MQSFRSAQLPIRVEWKPEVLATLDALRSLGAVVEVVGSYTCGTVRSNPTSTFRFLIRVELLSLLLTLLVSVTLRLVPYDLIFESDIPLGRDDPIQLTSNLAYE